MTIASPPYLPQPGQLVELRGRRFVVTETRAAAFGGAVLSEAGRERQHLVSMTSVEDDGLGEELEVLWEIEVGARVFEGSALPRPDGFDAPERLDAFLHAVRWGSVSSADIELLQAPFRSGIDIVDYQLEPLARALTMPRANLLIADDVGLGKTIEAGLVAQELIIRHRARTVLVLCPSSLQVQWKEQMRDKFGLEFRIIDSASMKELRRRRGIHVNPWTHFPRLITSIDYIKRDRPLRLFRETLPANGEAGWPRRYDLLIVDEAHNVAPSGRGQYAIDSLRTQCVRSIAPHFEHKLFLTATPHNGYQESFTALLELLDNQRFARGVTPDPRQVRAVMVRRMKSELREEGGPHFPERVLEALPVEYSPAERRAHEALRDYTRLRLDGARGEEQFAAEFVLKLLKKRLFSSPAAFASTLARHRASIDLTRARHGSAAPAPGLLRRMVDGVDEDYADDEAYEDSTADAAEGATRLFRPLAGDERALLDELTRWAEDAARRADSKAAMLIRWLRTQLKPDGKWNERRVLIFTEYRATQRWLHSLLAAADLAGKERLEVLYGGMDSDERERIKAAFQADPSLSRVRILLATDAASEGIDLQNHCAHLVHYEIPWNPNRMEQRNGRLDRHGQRADRVLVYHFVGGRLADADSAAAPGDLDGDLEFLLRAARKVDAIREDLGNVGPVLAQQVEEAMLGRRRTLDTRRAEEHAAPLRRQLAFERDMRQRLDRMAALLRSARGALDITPGQTRRIVDIALELAQQPPLRACDVPARDGRPATRGFLLPHLTGSWTSCADGMLHPHTREPRPLLFDGAEAAGRDDVVLAHLNHRLVAMALRLLRAELWTSGGRGRLHRFCVRVLDDATVSDPLFLAHGRLLVVGADGQRLHEEVLLAGGSWRQGRFVAEDAGVLEQLRSATLPGEPEQHVLEDIRKQWDAIAAPLTEALMARMRERSEALRGSLRERQQRDVRDITTVLRELQQAIEAELRGTEPAQLELWSHDEREQLRRNRAALEQRLRDLPAEREREIAAIRARYADPQPRMFPVAVEVLLPVRNLY